MTVFIFLVCLIKFCCGYSYHHILKSNFGIIHVEGDDAIQFLHSLSTNDISSAKMNTVIPSMLLNGKAKCKSHFRCLIDSKDSVRLLCDDVNSSSNLLEHLAKYRFPLDKVEFNDISNDYQTICVSSLNILNPLFVDIDIDKGCFIDIDFGTIISGDGLSSLSPSSSLSSTNIDGYTLLIKNENWSEIKKQLKFQEKDHEDENENKYEHSRILAGKPRFPSEINEDRCPLDLGLLPALHFEKGCFTGNEILQKRVQRPIPQRLCTFSLKTLKIVPSSSSTATSNSVLSSLLDITKKKENNKEKEIEMKMENEIVVLDKNNKVVGVVTSATNFMSNSNNNSNEDEDEHHHHVIGVCLLQRTSLESNKKSEFKLSTCSNNNKEVDIDSSIPIDNVTISSYAQYDLKQAAHPPKAQSVLETKKMLKSTEEELLEINRKEEKMKAMMEKVAKLKALKKN